MSITAGMLAGIKGKAIEFKQRAKAVADATSTSATASTSSDRVSLSKLAESTQTYRSQTGKEKEAMQNDFRLRGLLVEIKYAHIPLRRRMALIAKAVATWPDLAEKDKDDFEMLIRMQIQNEEKANPTEPTDADLKKVDEYIDEQLGIEKPAELTMIDSATSV